MRRPSAWETNSVAAGFCRQRPHLGESDRQGLAAVVQSPGDGDALPRGIADYASDSPKVMTYYSVKGLTFDSVFMPYLSPQRFENIPTAPEDLLFVGATRAQNWVYLSTSGQKLPALDLLEPEVGRSVTVRNPEDGGRPLTTPLDPDDIDLL